jgi:antitoxin HicB
VSQYSMRIHWSDEDQMFMVILPEFGNALTHGDTYVDAVKQGKDLIESYIMWAKQDGKPLPVPELFDFETMVNTRSSEFVGTAN